MSPEIKQTNQIRWRLSIVDRRMKEAVELLREAAAAPSYCGPPLDVVERMVAVIGEIRSQVQTWSIEEQRRRARRLPRVANRSMKRAIAEFYHGN